MTTTEIARLNERRHRIWNELRAISDLAADAGRDFTAEEETAWQRGNADLDATDQRIAHLLERAQRDADVENALGKYHRRDDRGRFTDTGLRSVLDGTARAADIALPDLEHRDVLKSGTGANVVPQGFAPTLVEALLQAAVVANVATRFVTTSGVGDLKVPAATAHPTAALTAEAASISESDPTFAQVTLTSYKYATLTQVSSETLQDSGVNLEQYLASRCGEAVGRQIGAHLVTGTGSSQPQGVVTGSTLGVTAAAAAAITMDEVIDLMHSVAPQYRARPGTAWLMADSTAAKLRKLKSSGGGDYLWEPSSQAGQPDRLLGHPVFLDPTMPASTTGNKSVLFGDMGAYGVRFTGSVRFERSDDFAFQNDLVTFRCVIRGDGRMLDTTGAVKHLIQA